ncbi:hypothetical protein [Streptococcus sp. Marseille-Q5986]|uniref:hypothetical protein n=1 Tax=Streptococcus sp. Marseille-Q5986 TaxID=2972782 RepID=UPI002B270208|nr:hypothetical protein [Streptococcus sp. Marseille-Q5986]
MRHANELHEPPHQKDGKLIPEQGGARSTSPAPVVIRKGLDIDKIMMHLADTFNSWDYRQGEYY